jgi:hypothetical protein
MATNNAINQPGPTPAFNVSLNTSLTNQTGSGAGAFWTWDVVDLNIGSGISTAFFYAPISGVYLFNYEVFFVGFTGGATTFSCELISNGSGSRNWTSNTENVVNIGDDSLVSCSQSIITPVNAGDRLYINAVATGGTATVGIQGFVSGYPRTYWSGCWLAPL